MEFIDVVRATSPRGELVLRERRDPDLSPEEPGVLELRVNGVFVMDTVETGSERAMASAALAQVEQPRDVVVGGLGLGFTVHEVLTDRRVENLVVVEVEEALVGWMRDGTVPHGPAFLADERVRVVIADIRVAMAEAGRATYDLVLLDVDNGPDALVHESNRELYTPEFLATVADVLRPGGAVAVWSASESASLDDALTQVFRAATSIPFEVRLQDRDERYWLYLAPG
jgi:spermidine synthase